MEIQGKIIAALQPREGVSQRTGNQWKSQEFVIETHDQYPKKCVFRVFGADRLQSFNLQVGGEYLVSFDIDAHQWQDRWFNDISAWAVKPIDPAAAQAATQAPSAPAPQPAAPQQPAAQAARRLRSHRHRRTTAAQMICHSKTAILQKTPQRKGCQTDRIYFCVRSKAPFPLGSFSIICFHGISYHERYHARKFSPNYFTRISPSVGWMWIISFS